DDTGIPLPIDVIFTPAITGFSPPSGRETSTVTLSGDRLGGVTSVRFGGVAATTFVATDDHNLSAVVPVGAITGPITMAVGSCAVATGSPFTVLPPGISIGDITVIEGETANFMVSLSNPTAQTVTVNYATVSGTATSGSDFVDASGSLTFS